MASPDHVVGQGDEGITIEAILRDADNEPVSIAGATIRFLMAPLVGGAAVIAAEASNDQVDSDETTIGLVSYEWQTADTATPGHYRAEWEVTFADDAILTFPNVDPIIVQITPKVGGA